MLLFGLPDSADWLLWHRERLCYTDLQCLVKKERIIHMILSDRVLLRLHVEAVWGVKLAPIERNEIQLLPESRLPDWRLCAADLEEGRVHIWRADLEPAARAELLARLDRAWGIPEEELSASGISREVAFRLSALPALDLAAARSITRPLTADDEDLLDTFWPGEGAALSQAELHPLIGVVVAGRLLSLAHSSRRIAEACELGIDTLPEARRRGYALAATVAWSAAIVEEGRTPIYSALAENVASLSLAVAAGYREFARAVTLA